MSSIYIFGISIPTNQTIRAGFTRVYGIGSHNMLKICGQIGKSPDDQISNLSENNIRQISSWVENNIKVTGDLQYHIKTSISDLISKRCYRGLRHRRSLPVRGQRSHTNARTQKRLGRSRLLRHK